MGQGNGPVSPLYGGVPNQPQTILGVRGEQQITAPIPIPTVYTTPNTALNTNLTPQNITNSISQSNSPFLGGSLNGSFVPSVNKALANTSISPNIASTGFGQIGVGMNNANSIGGIGTTPFTQTFGLSPSNGIPTQALAGIQTNTFSSQGFQRTLPGMNQINAVTPVGSYGTAPVGIPFVQPTGVPPVALPRRI